MPTPVGRDSTRRRATERRRGTVHPRFTISPLKETGHAAERGAALSAEIVAAEPATGAANGTSLEP
jgi:hypothetical protein